MLYLLISSLILAVAFVDGCADGNGNEQMCLTELDNCQYNADGTCTAAAATTTGAAAATTEEVDCDNSDLNEWRVDYIGKSTQFRIYDPCDSKFIKIKMEDLTEYDGDNDKKTVAKETSFASSKDWEWGEDSGSVQDYQGNDAIYNKFVADTLTKNDAVFTLETYFFKNDMVEICCDEEGNNYTLPSDSLKFNVKIESWTMAQSENYLVLCIGIMTNKVQDMDEDPDTKTYYINTFKLENIASATCVLSNGTERTIPVTIDDDGGNGKNHLDICYTFDPCYDGDIVYDPILYVGNNAISKNIFIAAITMAIISLFV